MIKYVPHILTFIAIIAAVGHASVFLRVLRPVLAARQTQPVRDARRTSGRTRHTLLPFLVAVVAVRAAVQAFALERKTARFAGDALRLGRTVARQTRQMA